MDPAAPTVTVFDTANDNNIELEHATYMEAAALIADHPRREDLRVLGVGFPEPIAADDFMVQITPHH